MATGDKRTSIELVPINSDFQIEPPVQLEISDDAIISSVVPVNPDVSDPYSVRTADLQFSLNTTGFDISNINSSDFDSTRLPEIEINAPVDFAQDISTIDYNRQETIEQEILDPLNSPAHNCENEEQSNCIISIPGTSSSSYSNFDFSPFKKYLKISDDIIISRKTSNSKSKLPSAITAGDYNDYLQKNQEKKKSEIEAKKERKRKREEKKNDKIRNKKSKNETVFSDSDEDDNGLRYDDSEDDLEIDNFEETCAACLGNENLADGKKWIGGNECPRWFHRSCLGSDFENMSTKKVKDLHYVCKICTKRSKSARKYAKKSK